MPWSQFVDMALSDEEKSEAMMPTPVESMPDYPCGLCICLTERELEKLELADDCEVGDMIDLRMMATVKSVSKRDVGDTKSCRIELQITHMAAENESTEDPDEPDEPEPAARRYANGR